MVNSFATRKAGCHRLVTAVKFVLCTATLLASFCNGESFANCFFLPPNISDRLQNLVNSQLIKGISTIIGGPFYTCKLSGTVKGSYQELSAIVEYYLDDNINDVRIRQFELMCMQIDDRSGWDSVSNSLTTPSVTYMDISQFTNCSSCTRFVNNENHCQACHPDCNFGLRKCFGEESSHCCVAYEDDGTCKPDLNCNKNNFVANEQNNFTCACGLSSCDDGFVFDDATCNCNLTDICQADDPCDNGDCILESFPDLYTCNCTGTNYTGTNCSVCSLTCTVGGYSPDSNCYQCILTDICLADDPCDNGVCVLGSTPNQYTCNCTGTNFTGGNCSDLIIIPSSSSSIVQPTPTPTATCNVQHCQACSAAVCCSMCSDGFVLDGCECVSQTSDIAVEDVSTTTSTNSTLKFSDLLILGISGFVLMLSMIMVVIIIACLIHRKVKKRTHMMKRMTSFYPTSTTIKQDQKQYSFHQTDRIEETVSVDDHVYDNPHANREIITDSLHDQPSSVEENILVASNISYDTPNIENSYLNMESFHSASSFENIVIDDNASYETHFDAVYINMRLPQSSLGQTNNETVFIQETVHGNYVPPKIKCKDTYANIGLYGSDAFVQENENAIQDIQVSENVSYEACISDASYIGSLQLTENSVVSRMDQEDDTINIPLDDNVSYDLHIYT